VGVSWSEDETSEELSRNSRLSHAVSLIMIRMFRERRCTRNTGLWSKFLAVVNRRISQIPRNKTLIVPNTIGIIIIAD
jgi:hypothetical protein